MGVVSGAVKPASIRPANRKMHILVHLLLHHQARLFFPLLLLLLFHSPHLQLVPLVDHFSVAQIAARGIALPYFIVTAKVLTADDTEELLLVIDGSLSMAPMKGLVVERKSSRCAMDKSTSTHLVLLNIFLSDDVLDLFIEILKLALIDDAFFVCPGCLSLELTFTLDVVKVFIIVEGFLDH